MNASPRTYYKMEIGGIVYLVDPATSMAYTYDLSAPTHVGQVTWTDPKTPPQLTLRPDWQTMMAAKLADCGEHHTAEPVTKTTHDDE